MRPLLLKGHERPLTTVRYNREGDLLFTAAKDPVPCVWFAHNGERLGTYKGHTGAVYSLDVDEETRLLVTGSSDQSTKLWDVQTGQQLQHYQHSAPARWVNFAHGGKMFLSVTDRVMGMAPYIFVYKVTTAGQEANPEPILKICGHNPDAKIFQAYFGPLNKSIYACNQDGSIAQYDAETGELQKVVKDHEKAINSMSFSNDQSHFVTASTDHTARVYDTETLECLSVFETGRPCNSAAISPRMPHVVLGGGQPAESVTTRGRDTAQFKLRFFHKIFEREVANIAGHFGPINCVAFSPDGSNFCSGGEDGYVRLHHLDSTYFDDLVDEKIFPRKEIDQMTPEEQDFFRD